MRVRMLFNPSSSFGGGVARLFDDYGSMRDFVSSYLRKRAGKAVGEWRRAFYDRLLETLERLVKAQLPGEHCRKLSDLKLEMRYYGEPEISIGKEKPLVITERGGGFGPNEISYSAALKIEVRAVYTTSEGEVKEAGQPYIPAHKEEHTSAAYPVLISRLKHNREMSLGEPTEEFKPYYHVFTNGSVTLVTDEEGRT